MSLVGVCCSCQVRESERAKLLERMDSVKMQLQASQADLQTLLEIGSLLDSIDRNRHDLLVDWREEKTPFNKYKYRLRAIHNYVVETEQQIHYLEEKLNRIRDASPDNADLIVQLNLKIVQRSRELRRLKAQLSRYEYENNELYRRVSHQDVQFDRKEVKLQEQAEALEDLKVKIAEAQEAYQLMQAESYFDEARALEEVANRTRFAGARKRATMEQALALYHKALLLGMEEAKEKIADLEKRIE